MRSNSVHHDNKSIRTFFLYTAIVCFFILLSLSIKAYFILKASRFDGKSQFIVAVAKNEITKEIIVFHPTEQSILLLTFSGNAEKVGSLGRDFAIIPDGVVDTSVDLPLASISQTLRTVVFHYYALKTNLTIFDLTQLMINAQKVAINDLTTKDVTLSKNSESNSQLLTNVFTDEKIFSENISIQIINASGTSGIGNRLEKSLSNLGCNVISVTTARDNERRSQIQYFGQPTYTLRKLINLLGFTTAATKVQPIADIVITIGEDNSSPEKF